MNYYQFHIGDFALHTSHLSVEEEGVYRRLLDYYYDTEKPIPKKTDRVIRRLRLGSHLETVALILDEFFVLEADGWHNLRADIEIKEYTEKVQRARENGKKGGRPKKNKALETQSVILANPEITGSKANQEPVTINHKPITNNSLSTKADSDCKKKKVSTEISNFELEVIGLYDSIIASKTDCAKVRVESYRDSQKQKSLRAAIKMNSEHRKIEFWKWYFENCSNLHYVKNGINGEPFKGNLDYFVRKSKFIELVEKFAS